MESSLIKKYNLKEYNYSEFDLNVKFRNTYSFYYCRILKNLGYTIPAKLRKMYRNKRYSCDLGMTKYQFGQLKKNLLKKQTKVNCNICGKWLHKHPRWYKNDKSRIPTLDHIIKLKNGGKTEENNLQFLCQDCHVIKDLQ